jgi:hypothetical protein
MKVKEFSTANSVKFTEIGDRIDGTIVEEPELQVDKFGSADDQVLVLSLQCEDGTPRRLYARKQMLGAIGQAVNDAGEDEIVCGGELSVEFIEERPTGGASPMKVYEAEYEPPAPIGTATLSGADDMDGDFA